MIIPTWVDEEFDLLNARHFDGTLPRPRWGKSPGWKAATVFIRPGQHLVMLDAGMLARMSRKFVSDSLLHELVHVALAERDGDGCRDHGLRFVKLANALGAKLGLPPVVAGSDAALDWPQSVRPKEHFQDEKAQWRDG